MKIKLKDDEKKIPRCFVTYEFSLKYDEDQRNIHLVSKNSAGLELVELVIFPDLTSAKLKSGVLRSINDETL